MTNNVHLHKWRPFSPPRRLGFLGWHPPHLLASGRQWAFLHEVQVMYYGECHFNIWGILSMLYLRLLYISWHMLGHYSFFPVSPWWLTLFPSKWSSSGMGFLTRTLLKSHCTIPGHTYHFLSLKPPISLSLGIFRVYWPKKGLSLIPWEEGF